MGADASKREAEYRAGVEAHPGLVLPLDRFTTFLESLSPGAVLSDARAADAYLTCACLDKTDGAVSRFDEIILSAVRPAVGKITQQVDEVMQQVRVQLFVPKEGKTSALASYSAVGPLRSWTRIMSIRVAYRLAKSPRGQVGVADERLYDLLSQSLDDPLADVLKHQYRDHVRTSFLSAIGDLERRLRTVLRMSVLDGLSIDEIAPSFHVHRATVARWLASARDELMRGTLQHLKERLGVSTEEAESIVRLVQSRLDMSLGGALKQTVSQRD